MNLNAVTETRDGKIWISSSILTRYDPRTDQATVIGPPQPTPTPVPEDQQHVDILGGIPTPTKGYVGPVFEAADGSLWFNRAFQDIVHWDPATKTMQSWGPHDGFVDLAPSLLNLFNRMMGIFGWERTEACIIFGMVSGITLIFSGPAARAWVISRFWMYLKTRKAEFGLSSYMPV